jgi:hypothetical protein
MILYSTKAIFWGKITSAILCAFLFAVYLQSSREMNSMQLQAEVNFFQNIVNISAVYAIYQMIGQLIGLPFVNPWIDGYMVEGYNWTATGTTTVSLGGIVLHRAHALFVEPSIMSQFLAINILIYAYNWNRRSLKYVILNALALILSFSGTGILLLIGGVAYMLLVNKSKKVKSNALKAVAVGICAIILGYAAAPSVIITLLNRVNELFSGAGNSGGTSSGFVRFVGVWTVLAYSLKLNPVLGNGIGSRGQFVTSLNFATRYTTDNGFVRVCIDLGVIGLFLYVLFLIHCYKNANSGLLKLLFFIIILLNFTGEPFLQSYYWALIYFFNIKCKDLYEEKINENIDCSPVCNGSR